MTPAERLYARNRYFWLVVVPTGACFGVWGVAILLRGDHEVAGHAIAGTLPTLGLLCVLAYRQVTGDVVRLWPYLPCAVAALVFLVSMEDLARAIAREPGGAFIPLLPYGLGFLLPFVTFILSTIGYVARKGVLEP